MEKLLQKPKTHGLAVEYLPGMAYIYPVEYAVNETTLHPVTFTSIGNLFKTFPNGKGILKYRRHELPATFFLN